MKKIKIISIFLALAVLTVLFTSCAKNDTKTPDNSTTESTTKSDVDATIIKETLYEKLIREIDGEFQKDYDEAVSTIEMVETCDKYAAK